MRINSIYVTKWLRPIFKVQQHNMMPGLTPAQLKHSDRPDKQSQVISLAGQCDKAGT